MFPAPRRRAWSILALALCAVASGCNQFGSRQRLEESRRYIQTLRSQNDQLKEQVLAYRNQNQDISERAVDDARRLAVQTQSLENMRRTILAYQEEREQLLTAYSDLRDSLPTAVRAALTGSNTRLTSHSDEQQDEVAIATPPDPPRATRQERRRPVDAEPERLRHISGWGPAEGR